jgi:YD repeat-containing protein
MFNSELGEDYRFPRAFLAWDKIGWNDPIYGNVTSGNDFWKLVRSSLLGYNPNDQNGQEGSLSTLQRELSQNLRTRRLNSIRVRTIGSIDETYQFDYLPLRFDANSAIGARRLLSSFTKGGRDGNIVTIRDDGEIKYTFSYDETTRFPFEQLAMTDHWGYYNGRQFSFTALAQNHAAQKTPSEHFAKAHTLRRITYPTGGYTTFYYELNRYGKRVTNSFTSLENRSGSGAGLRVREIKSYTDNNTLALWKRYHYITEVSPNGHTSSGILKAEPLYVSSFRANNLATAQRGNWFWGEPTGDIVLTLHNSGGFFAQSTNNRSPIVGYSSVIEQTLDQSGNSKGYVRYTFSNYDNGYTDQPHLFSTVSGHSYLNQFTSYANSRGNMLSEEFYDANGTKIRENIFYYRPHPEHHQRFRTVHQQTIVLCSNPWNYLSSTVGSVFYTNTAPYLLQSVKTIDYFDNTSGSGTRNSLTTHVSYKYNPQRLISSKTTTNSEGDTIKTEFFYPPDFSGVLSSGHPILVMAERNMINKPIEVRTSVNNSVVSGAARFYRQVGNLVLPGIDYALELNTPITNPAGQSFSPLNSNYKRIRNYVSYDTRGNLQSFIDRSDVSHNLIWGYGHTQPIAYIENATWERVSNALGGDLATLNNSTNAHEIRTILSNLRNHASMANAHVYGYTYRLPFGISSATDPSGITTYYEYDNFGRLITARDRNLHILEQIIYNYRTP